MLLVVVPRALDVDLSQEAVRDRSDSRQSLHDAEQQTAVKGSTGRLAQGTLSELDLLILIGRVDLLEDAPDTLESFEDAVQLARRRAPEVDAREAAFEVWQVA